MFVYLNVDKLVAIYSIGAVGTLICGAFGGWDTSLQALLICMIADYISGVIAACMGKSRKTKKGGLSSEIGFKGIAKKGMILLFVLVAVQLDLLMSTHYIRDGVCIAFIVNELVSITENAGIIGLPIPKILTDIIDLLKKKEGEKNGTNTNSTDSD